MQPLLSAIFLFLLFVQFTSLNDVELHFLILKQYPALPSAYSTD